MTEETTQQTSNNNTPNNQPATHKEVLAPLATYGVVAIGIVAIIITTAVMLNNELNTIEQDVAQLETDLAAKNAAEAEKQQQTAEAEQPAEPVVAQSAATEPAAQDNTKTVTAQTVAVVAAPTSQPAANDRPATVSTATVAENIGAGINAQQQTANTPSTANDNAHIAAINTAKTAEAKHQAFMQEIRAMMKQRIAEQQTMLKQRDQEHLESYKAAMNKQIEMLQQQIEHTQAMIADIEKRNQAIYQMRAASIEQRSERREAAMKEMLNRI